MLGRKTLKSKRNCSNRTRSLPQRLEETTLGIRETKKKNKWSIDRLTTNYIPKEIVGRDY